MYDVAQKAYEMCHGAQKESFVVHDIHFIVLYVLARQNVSGNGRLVLMYIELSID